MAQHKQTLGERLTESLRFWAVVVIICGVVGLIAYTAGKRYVSGHLQEMTVKEGAPEILAQGDDVVRTPGEDDEPPEKPIIVMQEREPTARERREVERELAADEPQDGAQLHAQEAEEEADADEPDDKEPAAADDEDTPADSDEVSAPDATGSYVVTAGSFASADNAQTQVGRLAELGYHPYVTRVKKDGVTFSRVNVGQFPERSQADEVADELKTKGFDAAVWAR